MAKNVQLTEEIVGRGGPIKVFIPIVIAVAVFAFANWGARRRLDEHTTNRTYWLIHKKWSLLEAQKEPVDWMFLGDSTCNQGVRPDVLEPVLGGRVMNYCTMGDMLAVNDAWMLSRSIQKGKVPKHVVLVHVFDVWNRGMTEKRRALLARVPLGWKFWERMEPKLPLSEEAEKEYLVSRYFPLYAESTTLTDWAVHPEKMFEDTGFSMDDRGYMRSDVVDEKRVHVSESGHLSNLRKWKSPRLSKENVAGLKRIAKLSDKYNFDLYLAMSPIAERVGKDSSYTTFAGKLRGTLSKIIRPGRRVHYVNFDEPLYFPADQMENADHVNHEAAEIYSRELGRLILEAKDADPKKEDDKAKPDEPEPEQDEPAPGDPDARHDDDPAEPR